VGFEERFRGAPFAVPSAATSTATAIAIATTAARSARGPRWRGLPVGDLDSSLIDVFPVLAGKGADDDPHPGSPRHTKVDRLWISEKDQSDARPLGQAVLGLATADRRWTHRQRRLELAPKPLERNAKRAGCKQCLGRFGENSSEQPPSFDADCSNGTGAQRAIACGSVRSSSTSAGEPGTVALERQSHMSFSQTPIPSPTHR
jgi:hypothetical protein